MVATLEKPAGTNGELKTLLLEQRPLTMKASAVLFAVGLSEKDVEDIVGLPEGTGEQLREMTVGLVLKIQLAMGMGPEKRISAMVQQALDVKSRLLASGDAKTQLAVSTDILDRNMGKAVQTTQSINTNLNITSNPQELDNRLFALQRRLGQISERKMKLVGPSVPST